MGTGILVQNFHLFPWSTYWLHNLSYVFWILNIILFILFSLLTNLRLLKYPKVALNVFNDFQQTSFLGAIPASLDTITAGLIIHYPDRPVTILGAQILFWIAVALTLFVVFVGIFAMAQRQGQHQLNEVTGIWLLTVIPLIVTAALGSSLTPHLSGKDATTIISVSFMMWSAGVGISLMIDGIYLWRLMARSLPPRNTIISCFISVGPLGMGAFAVLGLAADLAAMVSKVEFSFQQPGSLAHNIDHADIAQMIEWLGVISCFALLGLATFFLVEAFASVVAKLPRTFNVGFWGFVFPCGVYSIAFCQLGDVIRSDAMKGWAAACVVGTSLLWLMCAIMTVYSGVWRGNLFIAQGLQGIAEQQEIDALRSAQADACQ